MRDLLDTFTTDRQPRGWYTGIGSRTTPETALARIGALSAFLAIAGYGLRSGGAAGADTAFYEGAHLAQGRTRVYVPWAGFVRGVETVDASKLEAWDEAEKIASQHHGAWKALSPPARALHTRNVFQVLGDDLRSPSSFVLLWAPGPRYTSTGYVTNVSGGTGQAVRVAHAYDVPAVHLGSPRWVELLSAVHWRREV